MLQGALDERRPILRGAFAEDGGERRVADDEPVDDDPVRVDVDVRGGRELDDSCFHGPDRRGGP